jgi:hypothetical protein
MKAVDGRRRQWIPISAMFPHDNTGTRLQEELGPGAPGVWVALLTAAKRAPIQGRVSFTSELEFWQILGIHEPERLEFTAEAFLKTLGTLKQTRRTYRGRITNVVITQWDAWNTTKGDQQTSRSEQGNTDGSSANTTQKETDIAPDSDHDHDHEIDHDQKPAAGGFGFAVMEVKNENDPSIRDVMRVARHRYKLDPIKYDQMMEKQQSANRISSCDDCDEGGWLYFTADGSLTTKDDPDQTYAEHCSHGLAEIAREAR